MRFRPALLIAAAAASVALTAGCTGQAAQSSPVPDTDVAIVDDAAISRAAFDTRMSTITSDTDVQTAMQQDDGVRVRLRADVLAQMIEAQLLAGAADERGISISDEQLDAHIARIVEDDLGGGPDAWQRFLDSKGYPEAEIRTQLRQDLLREALEDEVAPNVQISDAQIAQFYDENYRGRPLVRHILVATEAEALSVIGQLQAGAEFGPLARAMSTDAESATEGGELGPWTKSQYVASFDEAIEDAQDGQLVDRPVASPFGFHVIQRLAPARIEDVSGTIRGQLSERQQDAELATWIGELRRDADIVVAAEFGPWNAQTGRLG